MDRDAHFVIVFIFYGKQAGSLLKLTQLYVDCNCWTESCNGRYTAVSVMLLSLYQGDTPKNRAEKAHDAELAAYLENRQHYQMIQREDQETAV